MLWTGEVYRELGPEHFQTRNPDAQARRLVRQLEALGHQVTLERQAA
jgi:hypothetical protein